MSRSTLEVCPWTCTTLWWHMGSGGKKHLRRILSNTFEESYTILTQIESCLNSRPLVPRDDDGIKVLTLGHLLIGRPLPGPAIDPCLSQSMALMVRQLWWSSEYLSSLRRYVKWHQPSRNIQVGVFCKRIMWFLRNGHYQGWLLLILDEINLLELSPLSGEYKHPVTMLLPSQSRTIEHVC